MRHVFPLILITQSFTMGGELFDPPEGFRQIEGRPSPDPATHQVEHYVRSDGKVQVTVVRYTLSDDSDGPAECATGTLEGMQSMGFENGAITDGKVRGFDYKRITGKYPPADFGEVVHSTTLILYASNAAYNLTINTYNSTFPSPSADELAEFLQIAGDPVSVNPPAVAAPDPAKDTRIP